MSKSPMKLNLNSLCICLAISMAQRFAVGQLSVVKLLRKNFLPLQSLQRSMAEIKVIKFEDLKDKVLNRKLTLIDVREPNELKDDGKIPNSVNIPLNEISDAFQLNDTLFQSKYGISKPDKLDGFVISCKSGKRATNAFNKLLPFGYENAFVYSGSYQDWIKNGGPIEK